MKIVAAGVSGFLGAALLPTLRSDGHEVVELVRREPERAGQVRWDPAAGRWDRDVLDGADAVVNFCGAGVGDRRWTDSYRALIRSSRVEPTEQLARACAAQGVPVLLNASAVGYYGDRGDEVLDETASAGTGFLADVCRDWEDATDPAAQADVRVVRLRTGLVVGADGGLWPMLARLSRFYLAGRLGSGTQFCPWISVDDHVAATRHLLDSSVRGAVNVTGPVPVRNKVLVQAIAASVHRPAPWWVPGPALSLVLGGFAAEILGGQRAVPTVLSESGFTFRHPTLEAASHAASQAASRAEGPPEAPSRHGE